MNERIYCGYCGNALDLGERFLRELEVEGVHPQLAPMEFVQEEQPAYGDPIPLCKACRAGIERNLRNIERDDAAQAILDRRAKWAWIGILISAAAFWLLLWAW